MTRVAVGRPVWVMVLLLPALAACAAPPRNNVAYDMPFAARAPQDNSAAANQQRLAITRRFTLPSVETEAIQQRHMAECTRLGCAILSTSIDRSTEGRFNARAAVRIKPESYDASAAVLAAPPAKIMMHSQSAEHLALPIFEVEKRLEAKTVLRDRLTALRDQSVKTAADLIPIEKELA